MRVVTLLIAATVDFQAHFQLLLVMFVNGTFGFEAALAGVAGLLLVNLLFVLTFVRDPHADPTLTRQPGALRQLVSTMVSFVKEVYSSFWQSGRGPKIGVAFAILPVGALALAYATLGTIQVDDGLKDHQIAELSIYNAIAAAIGCVVGGWLGGRFGSKRIVAVAYALTAAPTLVLGVQISAGGL